MAEAFAKKYATSEVIIQSAGSEPASQVNPNAIAVMKEIGLDIADQRPKLLTHELKKGVTHYISMGCGILESCPVPLLGGKVIEWELEDPVGKDLDFFRKVRDQIQRNVKGLLSDFNVLKKLKKTVF